MDSKVYMTAHLTQLDILLIQKVLSSDRYFPSIVSDGYLK